MTTGNDATATPSTGATPTAGVAPATQRERAGSGDTLTVLATADPELTARLDRELTAFNNRATGADDEAELNVRVTDVDGELVAGLTGWTWGGCAGINMIWVRADRRAEGWGGRLLRAFEAEAGRRGCTEVSVSSFSFQAPEFYRRHGYLDTGRREGIPGATSTTTSGSRCAPTRPPRSASSRWSTSPTRPSRLANGTRTRCSACSAGTAGGWSAGCAPATGVPRCT